MYVGATEASGPEAAAALAAAAVPHALSCVGDVPAALAALRSVPGPDLVVLDVALAQGLELLRASKGDSATCHVPVIVLWSGDAAPEVTALYRLHANCCLHRSSAPGAVGALMHEIARFWLGGRTVLPVRSGTGPLDDR